MRASTARRNAESRTCFNKLGAVPHRVPAGRYREGGSGANPPPRFHAIAGTGLLKQIREAWQTRTPLGGNRFKEQVEEMLGQSRSGPTVQAENGVDRGPIRPLYSYQVSGPGRSGSPPPATSNARARRRRPGRRVPIGRSARRPRPSPAGPAYGAGTRPRKRDHPRVPAGEIAHRAGAFGCPSAPHRVDGPACRDRLVGAVCQASESFVSSLFITLEGPDGSGKSTQRKLLAEHLESLSAVRFCLPANPAAPLADAARTSLSSQTQVCL
jgi:Thymidylate kinase